MDIGSFLEEQMRLHKALPSQMAFELGVSHATVSRWLSGKDKPSIQSCKKLADYSGIPLAKIISIVGYVPIVVEGKQVEWPEFREYCQQKYPAELDEDLIRMIEDLIQRRRARGYDAKHYHMGK